MRPLFLALVVSLLGCGGPDTSAITSLTGDAQHGSTLYEMHCLRCHGASAVQPTVVAKRSPDAVAAQVITGEGSNMPSFRSVLSDQDIADLIAWLRSR